MKPIAGISIFHTEDGKRHVMASIGSEQEILKKYSEGTVPLYAKDEFIKLIEAKIEYYKQFENHITFVVPLKNLIKDINER